MNLMAVAPHLNHDTSNGHTFAVVGVIAVIVFLLYVLFGGGKKK